MPTLPCPNGAGSINNPANPQTPGLQPYVPRTPCVGQWEITSLTPDECAINEQLLQENYIAETLNISGAPINIYKLLGVHEQGEGSLLSRGRIVSSTSYPGYPNTGINVSSWRSFEAGADVAAGNVYVGVDFGVKLTANNQSEYEPPAPNWQDVGSITITQSNIPEYWARQVRVDIADGAVRLDSIDFTGAGTGTFDIESFGSHITPCIITAEALTDTTFNCYATLPDNTVIGLGTATVGQKVNSIFLNFTINVGATPFFAGDIFTVEIGYEWKRVALFNLIQSPSPQILNLQQKYKVKAVRIVPTFFTGTQNWEVLGLDVLDTVPTDINNIQDIFFSENRDRDYAIAPLTIKANYSPADSVTDLSRFGLSILDGYTFTVSFATMVNLLGRPIVIGDIIEVTPELQYDQNLRPVRKFLEVTDTGWSSAGFGTAFKPLVYRFNAQPAISSQETRDIFGTLDTQKYLVPDQILIDGIGEQLNTQPLTITEEINKNALDDVPEIGTDDIRSVAAVPARVPMPAANPKGQPAAVASPNPNGKPNLYIESAIPPNNAPYEEGFKLPDTTSAADGDYFRLYYPPETKIPARLFRFSSIKNRWIFLETDRRGEYNSFKPSVQAILQSSTKRDSADKV